MEMYVAQVWKHEIDKNALNTQRIDLNEDVYISFEILHFT